jgi:hypothetical protein
VLTARRPVERAVGLRRRRGGWAIRPLAMWAMWRIAHLVLAISAGGGSGRSWDDGYYRTIMRQGYHPFEAYGRWQQTNFFPLLPWFARVLQFFVRSEDVAIQLAVTTAQIGTVMLLYALARRWRNEQVATTAVALLLLLPTSLFLWMFYTEGLFIALSMGAILAAERDRPLLAGILGAGVAATRSVGVLIAIPLALAAWQRRSSIDRRVLWCALPAFGLASVMLAQWIQADDALGFVHASQHWETQPQLPLITFIERLDFIGHSRFTMTSAIDIAAIALAVAAGVHAFRIAMPWSHRAWLWIMVLAPLSSGLIFSWSRYMLAAWPALLVGAELAERRPFVTKVILATLLVILSVNRIEVWHAGKFIG